MTHFSELGLSADLQKVLPELGFERPTEIQQLSIPKLYQLERDFIGLAQTGTGKTAAFGFPLIDSIDPKRQVTQGLVVAPTRELSVQIAEQFRAYSKYKNGLKTTVVYGGGANIVPQLKELKSNPQIIVATPGRLLDLIGRKAIRLDQIEVVVLDEADEMLNMGFKEDIDKILSFTPKEKLTWLFSATMPKEIRRIAEEYMHDPYEVSVKRKEETNTNITHQYAQTKTADKMEALKRFLDRDPDMRGVVFCRTRSDTQKVAETLAKDDYRVEPMHGDMTQNLRERVMNRFRKHELQVLVATDVAARGIDVDNLTHVIHYSLPDTREYYTHRSGRTARAGKKGISLALVNSREAQKLREYEQRLKISFEKVPVPSVNEVQMNRMKLHFEAIRNTQRSAHLTEEILDQAYEIWDGLDVDQLIEKLVSHEINKLNYSADHRDLNHSGRERGERGDRGRDRDRGKSDKGRNSRRKPKQTEEGMVTFFISMGRKDGLNETKLRKLISDVSGVKKKDLGEIRMRNLNSYFDVHQRHSSKLSSSFKGLEVNGRQVRVNRDNS